MNTHFADRSNTWIIYQATRIPNLASEIREERLLCFMQYRPVFGYDLFSVAKGIRLAGIFGDYFQ